MDSKLHSIVIKVLNRCTISEFNSFDEIIIENEKTVDGGKATFIDDEEIEYIKRNKKLYDNFLKICELVDKKMQMQESLSHKITTESILFDLNLSVNSEVDIPTNFRYLINDPENYKQIKGTVEEILIYMDLSSKPYEAVDKTL